MKILLTHRYFWPDTSPYGIMLRSIAGRLAADGHEVTVFSTQPSYQGTKDNKKNSHETLDGFSVIRVPIFKERKKNLPLRALNLVIYSARLRRHILKVKNYDVVTAATFPPIAAARVALGAAHKTGAKFVYHFQDVHPEVSLYSGQLKRGRVFNFLQRLDNYTCQKADSLVVLSGDMANTLRARPENEALQPKVISNIFLEDFGDQEQSKAPPIPKNKFVILFAGNIGRFQNLEMVITAAHELKDLSDVQFWFVGDGIAKQGLIKQAGDLLDNTVFFLPRCHHSIAQEMMGRANLNLVSLAPDIFRVAYPSKTLAILAAHAPILSTVEPASELSTMVRQKNIGFVAKSNNPRSIATTVRKAYSARNDEKKLRQNVKKLYQEKFSSEISLHEWSILIEQLAIQ